TKRLEKRRLLELFVEIERSYQHLQERKDSMTHFTELYRSDNYILTIYKIKPNNKVMELSSMQTSVEIEMPIYQTELD
ncbi:unnamed protein product, partial [Heterotrigona itama]